MKILSPAGNFESLKMAVFNGADEVYLGINNFNARNNIDGFSLETLKDAVDFAHIFGVKVDLAINILFNDNEMQNAVNTIINAYNLGVDAFIIQDIGLAEIIHKNYPEIELHSSTQMGIHNLEGVKAIEKLGFKRVVLARETPLEEVKRIRENSNIEIEYFAHGALCVSFSGNCYLSSYLCNASGNRGKCKQLCRLPYTLQKQGKSIKSGYLLSAKDFNLVSRLNDLKNAGVDVIKIEGRARRPFYVAMVTKEYKTALKNLLMDNNNHNNINNNNLKIAFNREFTSGYFNGNGNIISKYNNHIGLFVGKVEKFVKGKRFNEIYFSSNRPLTAKSVFKIFDGDIEKTTISAFDLKELSKGKYKLTTTHFAMADNNVNLIVDAEQEETILSKEKKKQISVKMFAEIGKPIKAEFDVNEKHFEVFGDICEKANNQPLKIDDFKNNFNKNELFNAKLEFCNLDNIFMPKQKFNEFRRNVFDEIFKAITSCYKHNLPLLKINTAYCIKKFENFKIIESIEDNFDKLNIVYSPEIYNIEDIYLFIDKCKQENKNGYLDLPNFALEKDIKLLEDIINKTKIGIVANNYYALNFDTNTIIGAGLNVYNKFTAEIYDKPIITAESEIGAKINYAYMTLRHCPLKSHLNANCKNCPYKKDTFSYKMQNGKVLKLKRKKLSTCTFYLTD